MLKFVWAIVLTLASSSGVRAGQASGSYRESRGEFRIGYAIAERDPGSGAVRILLLGEAPQTPGRDRHLDRLEAIGEEAKGGYLILEPVPKGDYFNITVRIENLGYGGGGQYPSEIEIGEEGASGKIEGDVFNGEMNVSFDAEYLPARKKLADLPSGGGEPGAALVEQLKAVASGERAAILRSLPPEHLEEFESMSADEQEETLAMLADFAPTNVEVRGGVLYDGYAIVEFDADESGSPAKGRALLVRDGEQWRIQEVSTTLE